jgi:hypothetical protein
MAETLDVIGHIAQFGQKSKPCRAAMMTQAGHG